MKVLDITPENVDDYDANLLNSGDYECFLKIHTPSCGFCKQLQPEWEKLEKSILKLPRFKKDTVDFERHLIGNANECEIDTEGRINIPQILRKDLGLSKNLIFVGLLSRFEIWSEKSWNINSKNSFKKFQKSRDVLDGI